MDSFVRARKRPPNAGPEVVPRDGRSGRRPPEHGPSDSIAVVPEARGRGDVRRDSSDPSGFRIDEARAEILGPRGRARLVPFPEILIFNTFRISRILWKVGESAGRGSGSGFLTD